MDIARLSDLRPRFMWDIIDDAFDLYRERFTTLLGIAALTFVPGVLLWDYCFDAFVHPMQESDQFGAGYLLWSFLGVPLFAFLIVLQMGAVSVVVDGQFRGCAIPSAFGAYRAAFRRAGSMLAVALAAGIACALTFPATMGVGTVWLFVCAAFIAPAVALENRSWTKAIKRSFSLTTSDRGRILGVLMLLCGIAAALASGLRGVGDLAYSALPLADQPAVAREAQQMIVDQLVLGITMLAIEPVVIIGLILMYFDLRVRRQGIDLAAQAEELGVKLAQDPFGDLASANVVIQQQRARQRLEKSLRR